jgi:hypothetical protein
MKHALAALVLGVAAVMVMAPRGVAEPTPENMQIWATKAQKYETRFVPPISGFFDVFARKPAHKKTLYASPVGGEGVTGMIPVLDIAYSGMFVLWEQDKKGEAMQMGTNASHYLDDVRSKLTHSPDKKLNTAMNKALDCVGDTFDHLGYVEQKGVVRCEGRWAQIEGKLKGYGVNTGDPWTLSDSNP